MRNIKTVAKILKICVSILEEETLRLQMDYLINIHYIFLKNF